MSILTLQLTEYQGYTISTLGLTAEEVIETILILSSQRSGLPKLISIANIVGKINDAGFELVSFQEVNKIAALITNYYTPTAKGQWADRSLQLLILPIASEYTPYYQALAEIRPLVIDTARVVNRYNAQQADSAAREAQNKMVEKIKELVQSRSIWWSKMPSFLMKTTLTVLFDTIIGFPLKTLVDSILGGFFDHYQIH